MTANEPDWVGANLPCRGQEAPQARAEGTVAEGRARVNYLSAGMAASLTLAGSGSLSLPRAYVALRNLRATCTSGM